MKYNLREKRNFLTNNNNILSCFFNNSYRLVSYHTILIVAIHPVLFESDYRILRYILHPPDR